MIWFYNFFNHQKTLINHHGTEYHRIGFFLFTTEGTYLGIHAILFFTFMKCFMKQVTIDGEDHYRLGDYVYFKDGSYRGLYQQLMGDEFGGPFHEADPDCVLCCCCLLCCPNSIVH
jgi:hypothetical protein